MRFCLLILFIFPMCLTGFSARAGEEAAANSPVLETSPAKGEDRIAGEDFAYGGGGSSEAGMQYYLPVIVGLALLFYMFTHRREEPASPKVIVAAQADRSVMQNISGDIARLKTHLRELREGNAKLSEEAVELIRECLQAAAQIDERIRFDEALPPAEVALPKHVDGPRLTTLHEILQEHVQDAISAAEAAEAADAATALQKFERIRYHLDSLHHDLNERQSCFVLSSKKTA